MNFKKFYLKSCLLPYLHASGMVRRGKAGQYGSNVERWALRQDIKRAHGSFNMLQNATNFITDYHKSRSVKGQNTKIVLSAEQNI
jgi:hypothetical protein